MPGRAVKICRMQPLGSVGVPYFVHNLEGSFGAPNNESVPELQLALSLVS